jgi:hypothetical protein
MSDCMTHASMTMSVIAVYRLICRQDQHAVFRAFLIGVCAMGENDEGAPSQRFRPQINIDLAYMCPSIADKVYTENPYIFSSRKLGFLEDSSPNG